MTLQLKPKAKKPTFVLPGKPKAPPSIPQGAHWIIASDLHNTEKPEDEYRWAFWEWLTEKMAALPGLKRLFILGDLTVDKDRHPNKLVNRLADAVQQAWWRGKLASVEILRANHDGLDDIAFFSFLRHIPGVQVHNRPVIRDDYFKSRIALLPHTKNPVQDWATIEFSELTHVFMHQTQHGAVAENDSPLAGDDLSWLSSFPDLKIWSGDVHVPQQAGPIEYVGAPYHVRFGDGFKGRVIHFDGEKAEDWHFDTVRKHKLTVGPEDIPFIENFGGIWLRKGDQVKFDIELERSQANEFQKVVQAIRIWCEAKGVVLCGTELKGKPTLALRTTASGDQGRASAPSPHQAMERYCASAKTPPHTAERGKALLKKADPGLREAAGATLRLKAPGGGSKPKLSLKGSK